MSESVKHYLSRLAPKSKPAVESILTRWGEWMGENGGAFKGYSVDELVQYQRENPNSYEVIDLTQDWIRSQDHLRHSTLKRYYNVVSSLFAHNRVRLPPDPAYSVTNGKPSVQGELTLGEIKRVIEASNPMYRALITCMAQGFMGIGEAIRWSSRGLEKLKADLGAGTCPIRIDYPEGRKGNRKAFYTYLGNDSIRELKTWLEVRPDVDHDAIFVTRYKNPLSVATAQTYWTDKLQRLAIIKPRKVSGNDVLQSEAGRIRYGRGIHEIRDCMRSRWRLSGCDVEVAEFFMGHSQALDKYGYDKSPYQYPEHYRDQYVKGMPWLNILTEDPQTVAREEVDRLRQELREARNGQSSEVEALREKVSSLEETLKSFIRATVQQNPPTEEEARAAIEEIEKHLKK